MRIMGKINILKSGFTGKVGQTYGIEKRELYYIKAVPFSHSPHNTSQKQAKNNFVGLNRVASSVVKKMWKYLNLSDKSMYKNNALCKEWKNALTESTFVLENIKNVISEVGALEIKEIEYSPDLFTFIYSANELNKNLESKKQIIYLAIITNKLITKADIIGKGDSVVLSSVFDYIDFAYFQVWAFKAVPVIKKWKLKGLSISSPIFVIIVNGVFYISRWQWLNIPYVNNYILYLPQEPNYINNGILFLR